MLWFLVALGLVATAVIVRDVLRRPDPAALAGPAAVAASRGRPRRLVALLGRPGRCRTNHGSGDGRSS